MNDLIERETVLAFVRRCKDRLKGKGLTYEILVDYIESIPSAERKGEWINKHEWANGFYERECSICGAMKPILMHTAKVNYCPNCGARMKGADDE